MLCAKAVLAGLFFVSITAIAPSRADAALPIEFTFGGTFTQTSGSVHQVGQPFSTVVLFDPASMDADPLPDDGRYPYLTWAAPGATANAVIFDNPPLSIGDIRVDAEVGGDHQWRLQYRGAFNFGWELVLDFPPATFTSDALPHTLDLQLATRRVFAASDSNLTLRGTIDSLSVRVIPEPSIAALAVITPIVLRRRHRSAQFQSF
jgi:hypothetical protein